MEYKPEPIDTEGMELSSELIGLTELLARNTHENWAAARIRNGWTYGPMRDDTRLQTPCLVPYDDLPENEKEYDRILTVNLLKTIMKLGFRITKEI